MPEHPEKQAGKKPLQPGGIEGPIPDKMIEGTPFPEHRLALSEPNGLLAASEGIGPKLMEQAYRNGIFPWFEDLGDNAVLWWTPDPRAVLLPKEFHTSRRLARSLKKARLSYFVDKSFLKVLALCATQGDRAIRGWLGPRMIDAYYAMHQAGFAHSFEAWRDGSIAGGVIYIQFGAYVSGESMFFAQPDGSKFALREICARLAGHRHSLLDCQIMSPHLASFGARDMDRGSYLEAMARAQQADEVDLSRPAAAGQG